MKKNGCDFSWHVQYEIANMQTQAIVGITNLRTVYQDQIHHHHLPPLVIPGSLDTF